MDCSFSEKDRRHDPHRGDGRRTVLGLVVMRSLRQSLLCREEVKLNRDVTAALMPRFLFSAADPGVSESSVTAALAAA
jgi:hypothetical protein